LRDWRIYFEFAQRLIVKARALYASADFGVELANTVYALDATTIDLCLSMFPWAPFRSTKAAVKLHTLLDLRGSIPTFIHVSNGKLHDVNVLDFERLYALDQAGGFFVTRGKRNLDARRLYSAPVDRNSGLICDQTIVLNGFNRTLLDRDNIFARSLDESIMNLGLTVLKSPPYSPMANAICERVIGTIRRECLDWLIPLSESHPRSILKS
jgi:hypothetical protein